MLSIYQNDANVNVDLYIPRKCSWTNRLLASDDHGSVQINVALVEPKTGEYKGECKTFALAGYIRQKAEANMAFEKLTEDLVAAPWAH